MSLSVYEIDLPEEERSNCVLFSAEDLAEMSLLSRDVFADVVIFSAERLTMLCADTFPAVGAVIHG